MVAGVAKLLGVDLVVHSKLSPTGTPRSSLGVPVGLGIFGMYY